MTAKAKPTPRPASKSAAQAERRAARTPPPGWQDPLAPRQPLISGGWLLRAVLVVVALAAVSAYLTLCLLFYQGQWQIVFHPSRTVSATPAEVGVKYDDVQFDYTGTGAPQLTGWWIPGDPGAEATVLFLHGGSGSLSDAVPQLKILHSLGANVFAFDYRGFGRSVEVHPSEQHVYEDADAAWMYLTDTRHLAPKSIVMYGSGLGATIAAEAALRHRESPALIIENPAPPALSLIEADSRTSLLPAKWLFRDRFEIAPKLRVLALERDAATAAMVNGGKVPPTLEIIRQATPKQGSPNLLLFLGPGPPGDPRYLPALRDFLSESLGSKSRP